MAITSLDHSSTRASTIADGDAAASEGRWSDAVGIWVALRTGGGAPLADERLLWFLDHAGCMPATRVRTPQTPWPTILSATGLGFLGTAIVLIGEDMNDAAAIVTSVAAWTCYLAAGVLILMYAYARYVAERDRTRLGDADVAVAIEAAKALDTDTSHHD